MPNSVERAPSSPQRAEPPTLATSALCAAAGVTRGVLRLYEREGLISPPTRTASGYRKYPAGEVLRLQAIRNLKEIGFKLREIALLLDEHDHGELDPVRLRELAREQLAVIDLRIARLEIVRGYMAAVAAGNTALIDDPECSFLVDFLSAGQGVARQTRPHPSPSLDVEAAEAGELRSP